jgi:hypothetical protein
LRTGSEAQMMETLISMQHHMSRPLWLNVWSLAALSVTTYCKRKIDVRAALLYQSVSVFTIESLSSAIGYLQTPEPEDEYQTAFLAAF